ncbi:hypothetical protein J132_10312 [Termitomyces sp. J132]|nr:hypothetical protein J132_10312 [Termitomyces sp. J132]
MTLSPCRLSTVTEYKYLGVIFDPKLHWSAHTQRVTASTTWWTHQIARLSHILGRIPLHYVCQLYNTVAIPAFNYAAEIWYTGVKTPPSGITLSSFELILLTCHPPSYQPSFSTHIKPDKDSALAIALQSHKCVRMAFYCNGSGYEGGIGASTVLFVDGKETSSLRYYLGLGAKHMVYKAEIVGATLRLHLLSQPNCQLRGLNIVGSNSQAMIKVLRNQCPHPAHYLLNQVHSAAEKLHTKQDCLLHAPGRGTAPGADPGRWPQMQGVI